MSGNSKVDSNEVEDNNVAKRKNYQKTSKSKKTVGFSDFHTFKTRLSFTKLRQAFVKASIFYHFDLECHI